MDTSVVIEEKPWGQCIHRYCSERGQIDTCKIDPGGYSSLHVHHQKYNMFIVRWGTVSVRQFDVKGDVHERQLSAGSSHVIQPGTAHQFVVGDHAAIMDEFYWTCGQATLAADDIERITRNGSGLPPERASLRFVYQQWKSGLRRGLDD